MPKEPKQLTPEEFYGLTNKELIELRLKCLEPFIVFGSKTNIEQDVIFSKARIAWAFAIEPLQRAKNQTTLGPGSSKPEAQ